MELKPYKTGTVVERYIKGILPIMLCVLLVYTSCRKDSTTAPSTSTQSTSNAALSKQIAYNLSKSLDSKDLLEQVCEIKPNVFLKMMCG